MRKLKKILSITICLVFTFVFFTTTVSAEENKQTTQTTITSEKTAYIDSILKDYFYMEKLSPSDDYYISNSFQINYFDSDSSDENIEIYFVFNNDTVIAMLTVVYFNNEYISSYTKVKEEILTTLYADNTPFALITVDNDLYVYHNNQLVPLLNDATTDLDIASKSVSTQSIVKERNYAFTQTRSNAIISKILSVSHVQSDNNPDTNEGLCWAACIAMKVNYYRNYVITLSALDILANLENRYTGTPVGNPTWIRRGYELFNINCTYVSNGLIANAVSAVINNNKPIHIGVSRNNHTVAHGVLIVGYTLYTNKAEYVIDDPNIHTGYKYQSISFSAMINPDNFIYVGERTYDNWYESFY